MKKFICVTVLLAIAVSLCSCKPAKTDVDDPDKTKQTVSGVDGVRDDPKSDGDVSVNYVRPTTFSKAYSNVSDRRNEFYDAMTNSLVAAGENTQVLLDVDYAIAGESTFVIVSACGMSGYEDIAESVLLSAGYSDPEFSVTEDGRFVISAAKGGSPVSFRASYDSESDSFRTEAFSNGKMTEMLFAKRLDDCYAVQYIEDGGKYIRYILCDDGTACMYVSSESAWIDAFPETKLSFVPESCDLFYEVTENRFHSIHNGVEYTYGLVTEKTSGDEEK